MIPTRTDDELFVMFKNAIKKGDDDDANAIILAIGGEWGKRLKSALI
jgi:hypothetical protein